MPITRLSKFISQVAASSDVASIILEQLGGASKLTAMTGAKNFVRGRNWLKFDIGRNSSTANRVQVVYNSGSDTYDLVLLKYSKAKLTETQWSVDRHLQVAELRRAFKSRTGLELSLGRAVVKPTNSAPGKPVHPAPVAPPKAKVPAPVAKRASSNSKMQKLVDELSPAQRNALKKILNGG